MSGRGFSAEHVVVAVAVVVATACLTSVTFGSSPDCQELVRPFVPEHPHLVYGRWIYVGGSGAPELYHQALGSLKTSWIQLSSTNHSQMVTMRWGDRCFDRCIYGEANATVSGVATMFHKNLSDHKGHMIRSCDGCLLWTDTFRNGDVTGRYILQFTRTGTMEQKDLEVFKQQVGCLNFPQNYHRSDEDTELCPDMEETND